MRLIIVGDLSGQLYSASKIAKARGGKIYHAPDIASAIRSLCSGNGADFAMMDVGMDIKEFYRRLEDEHIVLPIIACGIDCDSDRAANAIKDGAIEYIPLPPEEELIAVIFENISKQALQEEIIYKSESFASVMSMAERVAASEASVLITGPSGTGKEILSRFIHNKSKRKMNDMIAINCAAIPENLLESEMFGHEKGAFTGALERRIGKFEEATKSTILLDEISEMDIALQAKLLRVLQEKEITRIGSNNPVKLDIRVIATSNRDLPEEVANGRFRQDLFYRLNVIHLELPALNERKDDIEILASHFIKKYSKINGVDKKLLTKDALAKLITHSWEGNIRELENTMHRAVVLASGDEIDSGDIVFTAIPEKLNTLADTEKRAIMQAMNVYGSDLNRAASVLGVSIKILNEKLQKYKL